jgi:hypothetical protein
MRSIAHWGLVAVAVVLAGCQINPYGERQPVPSLHPRRPDLQPRAVRFPIVLTFPDETMYFYPIYDNPPRADLNLRAISCTTLGDGTLLLTARVQNMGADIVTNTTLYDFASFRVLATVTNANGLREDVSTAPVAPLTVASTVSLPMNPTRFQAADVTRIDVVADPDRIVPDPIRDNNVLSWQGRMGAMGAQCNVVR